MTKADADTLLEWDRTMRKSAPVLWSRLYSGGRSDDEAFSAAQDMLEKDGRDLRSSPMQGMAECYSALWNAKWAQFACPTLRTRDVFAAALMATRVEPDLCEDIHLPWPAFLLEIPANLLRLDGQSYQRLTFSDFDIPSMFHGRFTMQLVDPEGVAEPLVEASGNLSELLFEEGIFLSDDGDEHPAYRGARGKKVMRVLRMAKRLLVGALFTIQHTNNFKTSMVRATRAKSPWTRGEPAHRVIEFGRPLVADCAQVIRDYVDHGSRGGPPSVQTLVTGHRKRQVVGVGGRGRKIIWIEPYWRGPEDAPILTRPRVLQ